MLTFSERAIAALNDFGRRQTAEVLRVAIEKAGCGEAEFLLYPSERLVGDRVYAFRDCLVAVDPVSGRFLEDTLVDLDPEEGLLLLPARRASGGCGGGGCGCSAAPAPIPRTPFADPPAAPVSAAAG